ncbi:phosphotransferase [Halorussus gelatinilyticus]|uniref:Phosphotransferase n=1 Tax=Halorussus gelatinilyticus TaxID=2937524 RepID=A0A8U0IKH4_9EURY|nr:phosphotransferase [Halorussus gelatinilyticus]UPW00822.1 phosphotransferase [Halorussus gelatinilyticus]
MTEMPERTDAEPTDSDSADQSGPESVRADRGGEWADVLRMVTAVAPSWSVERIRPQDGGTDDVAFLTVATPEGPREVVLKSFSGDGVPAAVARSEPRVLELLARETDLPVPEVVGFVDDHPDFPAPFFIAERLPGEDAGGRFFELSADALETLLADAGTHLAQLHELRSFDRFGRVGVESDRTNEVEGSDERSEVGVCDGDLAVVGDQYGSRARWTDWLLADAEDALDGLSGGRFDDLVPALREYAEDAIPALDGPETASLVHWDYRLGNLLVDPETGETTGVLDWADLLAGDPVYNFATVEDHAVNWRTRDPVLRRRLRDAFREAYRAGRSGDAGGFRDRKHVYHFCNRLHAMVCHPDWYADADPAVREERAAEHRMFVRSYLD